MRSLFLTLCLSATAAAATPQQIEAAKADYRQMRAAGQECRYLELPPWHPQEASEAVCAFVACVTSQEPYLPSIVPQRATEGLLRLNLTALRWSTADWQRFFGAPANPYTPHANPLIVPAAWWVDQIADGTRSEAYLRLLWGKRIKTLDEFWAAAGIDQAAQQGYEFGWIEGDSRVNLARYGARLIRHDDGTNVEAWSTYDVSEIADRDPLDALLLRHVQAEGTEVFALLPKVAVGVRGVLPATILANGDGVVVHEAPVGLVEDSTRFAGQAAIRNPGSCWQCHSDGPQAQSTNALRERLAQGVELYAYDYDTQTAIERFHLGTVEADLQRWADGYATAIHAINGLTPRENAAQFRVFHQDYLDGVSLDRAAAELGCEPDDLRLALGWASSQKRPLTARIAELGQGGEIPRRAWEHAYIAAREVLEEWRTQLAPQ